MCQHRSMSRKYRNVRHKRILGVGSSTSDRLLRRFPVDLSASVEMSTLVATAMPSFYP
jgi:hypothetical protein